MITKSTGLRQYICPMNLTKSLLYVCTSTCRYVHVDISNKDMQTTLYTNLMPSKEGLRERTLELVCIPSFSGNSLSTGAMAEMAGEVYLNRGAQASPGSEQGELWNMSHSRADVPLPFSFCLGSSHHTWMQYALFSMLRLDRHLSRN